MLLHGRCLPNLFIYSVIYLHPYGHMDIYCIFRVIIRCQYFLCCANGSSFGYRDLLQLAPVSLWLILIVGFVSLFASMLSTSLLPGTAKCSRLMLHISCFRLESVFFFPPWDFDLTWIVLRGKFSRGTFTTVASGNWTQEKQLVWDRISIAIKINIKNLMHLFSKYLLNTIMFQAMR